MLALQGQDFSKLVCGVARAIFHMIGAREPVSNVHSTRRRATVAQGFLEIFEDFGEVIKDFWKLTLYKKNFHCFELCYNSKISDEGPHK